MGLLMSTFLNGVAERQGREFDGFMQQSYKFFLNIPAAHNSTNSLNLKRLIMRIGPNTYASVPRVIAVNKASFQWRLMTSINGSTSGMIVWEPLIIDWHFVCVEVKNRPPIWFSVIRMPSVTKGFYNRLQGTVQRPLDSWNSKTNQLTFVMFRKKKRNVAFRKLPWLFHCY